MNLGFYEGLGRQKRNWLIDPKCFYWDMKKTSQIRHCQFVENFKNGQPNFKINPGLVTIRQIPVHAWTWTVCSLLLMHSEQLADDAKPTGVEQHVVQ